VRKDRYERAGGGVAIFIKNKLKYSRKEGLYDGDGKIELCAIELYTGQEKNTNCIMLQAATHENRAKGMENFLRKIRR
jgi:hypothetical protein